MDSTGWCFLVVKQSNIHLLAPFQIALSMSRSFFKSTRTFSNVSLQLYHSKTSPNTSSSAEPPYLSLLKKCSTMKELKQIHTQLITIGLVRFTYITSTLLAFSALSENGDMNYAESVFNQIKLPTIFNCNIMIQGYSKSVKPEMGILVYVKMRSKGVVPNIHTFPVLIKSCYGLSPVSQVHGQIVKFAFDFDVFVISSLIKCYSKYRAMKLARQAFDETPNRNVVCWTSLITGYCFHGLVDDARELFDKMPERNDVSWSAMISGYVQNDHYNEAIQLFRELKCSSTLKPNRSLLVSVLNACSGVGAFDEGKWIHSYIDENGHGYGLELGTALVDFYAKCGCIKDAKQVFRKMPSKDVMAWSAMIMGLATNGHEDSAVKLFKELEKSQIKPNSITFIGVLTACSHGGLVEEGWGFFRSMSRSYGISPRIEHYGCMVDLLSRAGQIKEAEQLINSMPMEPDGIIWGALLNGCVMHGYVELGEKVGKHLIEVEPQHNGRYVHLSNIYASMGRWEGVLDLRRLMKERRVTTGQGWSSIEISGNVHRFILGDKSHPCLREIYDILSQLNKKITNSSCVKAIIPTL